jgi:hypothetical protein
LEETEIYLRCTTLSSRKWDKGVLTTFSNTTYKLFGKLLQLQKNVIVVVGYLPLVFVPMKLDIVQIDIYQLNYHHHI